MKARLKDGVTNWDFDNATFGGWVSYSRYGEFLSEDVFDVNVFDVNINYIGGNHESYAINDYSYAPHDFYKIFEIVEE